MTEESTTPDPEEALRGSMVAFNRRDFDGALSIWAPDGTWDSSLLGVGVFEGREAIPAYMKIGSERTRTTTG